MKSLRNCPGSASRRYFSSFRRARFRRSRIQWSTFSSGRQLGSTSFSSVSQKEWKVASTTSLPRSPTAFTTRVFISPAAFFVNVSPRIFSPSRVCVRFKQVPDALRDDAGLAGARARDHQQRSFAVGDRAPLRFVRLQLAAIRLAHLK